jgi:hypothetical protein
MMENPDPSLSPVAGGIDNSPSNGRPQGEKAEPPPAPTSATSGGLTGSEEAPERLKITTGGLLLWAGTVSIGISTVVLLAILSHHFHRQGFTGLSALFGLFFVASLIPSGIPLRAAALAVDGAPPMRMTAVHVTVLAVAGAAISPLVAYALHLPVLAVLLVAGQVLVAIPLAIRRGSLIAAHRFDAMGGSLFLESAARVVFGVVAGLLWGLNGVSGALVVAIAVALVAVPSEHSSIVRTVRQMTSLLHTWLALVLLGLFVQLDILIAPSVLTHSAATRYDVAAVPSKGVNLVLIAVSTLIFPHVRVHAQRRTVVVAATATLGVGLVVTCVLVAMRGAIGAILGQNVASVPLLMTLGAAMSIAGATGIVINGGIALGVARPWPPLVLGMACLLACWFAHPGPLALGTVSLAAQGGTLMLTAWVCLRKQPVRAQRPSVA